MVKVEVIPAGQHWKVEITYREPFEDLFEVAQHVGLFESKLDAEQLCNRVKRAVAKAFPNSPRTVLDEMLWNWGSSVIDSLYKAPRKEEVFFKTSKRTLAYIKEMSQGG